MSSSSLGRECQIVAVGASTGGPAAVAEVLGALPASLPVCIVVAQHFQTDLVTDLGEWLSLRTGWPVRVAIEGDSPREGQILLADEQAHLMYTEEGFSYREGSDLSHTSSIDDFFLSLSRSPEMVNTAVLLTGLGSDGAKGLLALREAGCYTIAQDFASATVEGMPKAASELGAAREILPLEKIGHRLLARIQGCFGL